MARKGPPEQAKHFRHEDHEHATHQQETSLGHTKPSAKNKASATDRRGKTRYSGSATPRGPRRGQ
jgi:hypothetical protein